jgi:hypothetical protein
MLMLVHQRDPAFSSHVERPNSGMSTVPPTKYNDPKQLLDSLRIETTEQGRDDIVLAALTQGVDLRIIESMLDQIEMEAQSVNQKIGVRKSNVLGRLYWFFFQRQGRRRLT